MRIDGRSLLFGMGLFGMVVGACLAVVAGQLSSDCAAGADAAAREGARQAARYLAGVCGEAQLLQRMAVGLTGLSALVAAVPVFQEMRANLRRSD